MQGQKCDFFQWIDDEMGDRAKVVIKELRNKVETLEDANIRLMRGEMSNPATKFGVIVADLMKIGKTLKVAIVVVLGTFFYRNNVGNLGVVVSESHI